MVRPVQAGGLSTPVQCVTDRYGVNGVVVYGDRTSPIARSPVLPSSRPWSSHGGPNMLSRCPFCHSDLGPRGRQTWWILKNLLFAAALILVYILFN